MVIDGTSYNLDGSGGNTAWPGTGVEILTDLAGNPTVPITLDPTAPGATTITIEFVAIDNGGAESVLPGNAVLNLAGVPDLTPTILLPSNTFAADEVKNVILSIVEINNNPTVAGTATFIAVIPNGYVLETYDNTLTSFVPTGGSSTAVNNTEISEVSRAGNTITFRTNAGVSVNGQSLKRIGVRIRRTTANAGSVSRLTLGVLFDASGINYDSNIINNTFTQIFNAQNPL
jgi:hypothetical protein